MAYVKEIIGNLLPPSDSEQMEPRVEVLPQDWHRDAQEMRFVFDFVAHSGEKESLKLYNYANELK